VSNALSPDSDRVRLWRANPIAFVEDPVIFGATPDPWQRRALMGLVTATDGLTPQLWGEHRIALPSCAGPGKTAWLAWAGQWAMACFSDPANERYPKGAAVAIDRQNLRDNLWAEMSLWHGRSEYLSELFVIDSEKYYAKGYKDKWFLSARAWAKRADAGSIGRTLSGLHAPWVILMIDESAEIPVNLMLTAEQALANQEYGAILQCGNCVTRDGMLFAAVTKYAREWLRIRITADPEDPERSTRIPKSWAQKWIDLRGRDDPWVQAFILGQFPDHSLNTLLTSEEVEEAFLRNVEPSELRGRPRILGVDPADEGLDLNVIFPRQGRATWRPWSQRNVSSTLGARMVAEYWTDWLRDGSKLRADACFIDRTGGYGGGWEDRLRDDFGFSPQPVKFSEKASDDRYQNVRAEIWFKLAEWIKDGGALPPQCRELVGELSIPRWYINKRDQFAMEDKDMIRSPARLGRSPDFADALALTFTSPVEPNSGEILPGGEEDGPFPWKKEPQRAIMDDEERFHLR